MKKLFVVGVGMGKGTLTGDGLRTIAAAEAVFGSQRLLSLFAPAETPTFPLYDPQKVYALMAEKGIEQAALLVSGDTGFYSAARQAVELLPTGTVTLLPGISSVSYFFSKLGKSWQDAKLISCHGRDANLTDTVRRHSQTFALTGGNCSLLAKSLCESSFTDLTTFVGENLGTDDEKVYSLPLKDLSQRETAPLTVLLIENPHADARIPTGLPDEAFVRGSVPMTKSEVRAVIMSRLGIKPADTCWDVGCGTGSVTVEMALAAYEGRVYAVDQSPEAIALTTKNCRRFHLGNVSSQEGAAPAALQNLPAPDRVFIGGSSGEMSALFSLILSRNPRARIVVTAIALESAATALQCFRAHGIEPQLLQLAAARGRLAGELHLMMGQNPVYLLSGGTADE